MTARGQPPSHDDERTPLATRLARLGIRRRFDLVLHLPLRYEDLTHLTPLRDAKPGEPALVEANIVHAEIRYRPKRSLIVQLQEGQDTLVIRFLNFYPSMQKQLAPGKRLRLFGEVRNGFFGAEMVHPKYRVIEPGEPLSEALTPVYPTTAGLAQSALIKLIQKALAESELTDTLDAQTLAAHTLPPFRDSVVLLHSPPPDVEKSSLHERTHPAWQRLKFDELLAQQLAMRIAYAARRKKTAAPMPDKHQLTNMLVSSLPFKLTRAQRRTFAEISHDLAQPHPMQRLLQGDVGSGKTLVAALAALQAIDNDFQVAFMAPTEILAEQHYRKLEPWLAPLGVKVAWLTGSLKPRDKEKVKHAIAFGEAQLAIGTHALFQEDVTFAKLGLAIVDEQHRFGVGERLALRNKGEDVHQLMMSATPIPRTLSMSYFADLDVSVIDELPPGRKPISTRLVSDARRQEVVKRVRAACADGAQAYWVCPLIEESDKLQLETAIATFEAIKSTFPDLTVGLVHGRLKPDEKAQVMDAFKRGAIQLLVATTVIEVGVDVPNASLMVIENAERMGLAQLHQLRGRVGRGSRESACILLYKQPLSETGRERLKIIYENSDGFEIARLDLHLRGPGEFLGARQSGVPLLRFADLEKDAALAERARTLADKLIARKDPAVKKHLERWLGGKQSYLKA